MILTVPTLTRHISVLFSVRYFGPSDYCKGHKSCARRLYVCMCVCVYACMYACMYECVCVCVCLSRMHGHDILMCSCMYRLYVMYGCINE